MPNELYTFGNMIAYERRAANNRLLRCPNEIKDEIKRRCKLLQEIVPVSYKDPEPELVL